MFNLSHTPEQAAVADAVRQLGERWIRTIMQDGGRPGPDELASVWRDLHEMGLTAPVSAEYAGQGIPDTGTSLLIAEEVGYADPGIAYDVVSTCQAAAMIETLGTEAQRSSYLPRFAQDPQFSAGVAYFEGFGRAPSELEAVATRSGDHWELNGGKIGVTRPADADLLVVVAADADTDEPVAFAVEPSACTGVTITRDDDEVGKLGLDAVKTGCIELRAVTVPEAARLSGPHSNAVSVHRRVATLRLGVGSILLGTARAELTYAVEYARTREAFGSPIMEYQGVAFPLVEVDTELDATRLQLRKTALGVEAEDDADAMVTVTGEAIARCQRIVLDAGRIGINTLGGHGFIQDHPLEQWYRSAATLAALDFDPLESDNNAF